VILQVLIFVLCVVSVLSSPQVIRPGEVWLDTSGHVIQAHGAGLIRVDDTWYWFGEDKTNGAVFQNVRCYSSTDLAHWTFRANSLTRQSSGDLGPNRIIERPKVIYNNQTKNYVMYVHVDSSSYGEAKVGVATSDTVIGPYKYLGSFQPLGHQSRDMTLYKDKDGTGYLVFEDRQRGVSISRLSDDYLTIQKEVSLINSHYEAPAVVEVDQLYYLLGSHLTGWDTNDNQYTTSRSLSGPWGNFNDVAPAGTKTYNSQTAYILPVEGSVTTSYIYIGDRWVPQNLTDSRYMWMPLTIRNGVMTLAPDRPWSIDAVTGQVSTF